MTGGITTLQQQREARGAVRRPAGSHLTAIVRLVSMKHCELRGGWCGDLRRTCSSTDRPAEWRPATSWRSSRAGARGWEPTARPGSGAKRLCGACLYGPRPVAMADANSQRAQTLSLSQQPTAVPESAIPFRLKATPTDRFEEADAIWQRAAHPALPGCSCKPSHWLRRSMAKPVRADMWRTGAAGYERRQQHGGGAHVLDVLQPVQHPQHLPPPLRRHLQGVFIRC